MPLAGPSSSPPWDAGSAGGATSAPRGRASRSEPALSSSGIVTMTLSPSGRHRSHLPFPGAAEPLPVARSGALRAPRSVHRSQLPFPGAAEPLPVARSGALRAHGRSILRNSALPLQGGAGLVVGVAGGALPLLHAG